MKLVTRVFSAYDRRIMSRVTCYPTVLLRFAWGDADERSPDRYTLARDLLEAPLHTLHITARKIVALFTPELWYVRRTEGRVPMALYSLFRLLSDIWRADTQEIEGVHNLIKLAAHKSTSSSQATIDASVGLRKAFGFGGTDSKRMKFSSCAPYVDEIVDTAIEYKDESQDIVSDRSLFAPPRPAVLDLEACYEKPKAIVATPCLKWALAQTLEMSRRMKKHAAISSGDAAIVITVNGAIDQLWLCGFTYQGNATLLRAMYDDAVEDTGIFCVSDPATSQVLTVFSSLYDRVVGPSVDFEVQFRPCYLGFGGVGVLLHEMPLTIADDRPTLASLTMLVSTVAPKLPRPRKQPAAIGAHEPAPALCDDAAVDGDDAFVAELFHEVYCVWRCGPTLNSSMET